MLRPTGADSTVIYDSDHSDYSDHSDHYLIEIIAIISEHSDHSDHSDYGDHFIDDDSDPFIDDSDYLWMVAVNIDDGDQYR